MKWSIMNTKVKILHFCLKYYIIQSQYASFVSMPFLNRK